MQILDFLIVRNDARGDDQLFLPGDLLAVNHRLRDLRHLGEQGLDLLRIDVFSVLRHDDIFASAGDIDKAVLVHIANVAGVEPAVLHDRGCRRRILVIAQHDRFTANQQLALALFIRIFDLNLVTVNSLAGGAHTRVEVRRQRCDRRSLRQTVALQRHDTQIAEKL